MDLIKRKGEKVGPIKDVMHKFKITDTVNYKKYGIVKKVLKRCLKMEGVHNSFFEVILVDNNTIQKINKEYRNIDRVTDVISFALEDVNDVSLSDIRVLGDIYICIDRMKEQAIEYNHSETRELSFLTVHGLLHLLGYDHQTKEDEEVMFNLQRKILSDLNINR